MCFDFLCNSFLKLISVFNQLDAQNLFHNKFYFMPYLALFGLSSDLGNTLQYRMLLYLLSVPNILGIQVCVIFVSVQCSTAYVLTVDFGHEFTLQN